MNLFNNNEIFRAYSPSVGKKPQVFKDGKALYARKYDKVPDNELPNFEDIESDDVEQAIGFINEDTVLVDVDTVEESEKLLDIVEHFELNTLVVQTSRGSHFYFKNVNRGIDKNRTETICALGIEVDYKAGHRNGIGTIKDNKQFRHILWEPNGPLDEVPKFLWDTNSKTNLSSMKDGDGRNQSLFNHILTLQSAGLTKEESKETLQLINDFILAEPLDKSELESITRDEAFTKPVFFKKNKFLFNEFAEYLTRENNIKRINGRLHVLHDEVHTDNRNTILSKMIEHIPTLSKNQRNEVLSYLEIINHVNTEPSPPHLILFKNGVLNVITGEITQNNPEHIFTNKINWNYKPDAYDELADKTLSKISVEDEQVRLLLEEMIGSTFYRSNTLGGGGAFLLTGDKSNGKSTLLSVIQKILGQENTSSLDIKELGERFKTAELFGKLANIGDDISSEYIPDASVFKKLVTGESISAEKKGQDPFDFINYSKLLFSANEIPRLGRGEDSGALARRLIIIPFNASFSKKDEDYNPNIKYDLQQEKALEYFIKLGVEGLKRILKNNGYTKSVAVEKELKSFEASNDPLLSFLEHKEELGEPILDVPIRLKLHRDYKIYCDMNGHHAYSQTKFTSRIKKRYNLDSKQKRIRDDNGRNTRDNFFVKKE